MGDKTAISWTDATWNPVVGCSQVSPGCAHCYAKTLHGFRHKAFMEGKDVPAQYAVPFETVQLMGDRLDYPLRWRTPRRIFVNSVSDLFHESVPFAFIDKVFAVMALAPQHIFQVLTKRPERMLEYMSVQDREIAVWREALEIYAQVGLTNRKLTYPGGSMDHKAWPIPNVWLGVSAENQHWWDHRVAILSRVPAAVRFVSVEPMLGPIDVRSRLGLCVGCQSCFGLDGRKVTQVPHRLMESPIHWLIVGGESGPNYRPMDLEWARVVRARCKEAGVAFFFKQSSAYRSGQGDTLDGVRWHEFPNIASKREAVGGIGANRD
jgi:protein gp37